MTPSDIEVLLHIFCCPTPHPRREAPAVKDGLRRMVGKGLIYASPDTPDVFEVTPKGGAHVSQLCDLPLPIQTWVSVSGEPIKV